MANLSTLTVSLVAETGKFENGLKKSRKSADGFGKAVAKAMKAAAVATGLFGAALGALVAQSLKMVDQQRKTARTLSTSQATFAGLSLAAGIAGLEIGSFTKALKRQSKSIIDAADGLQTQKRALDRLGLSTKDLLALPIEEQFKTITTALGEVTNATLKVGIASDLYGAKNADLINIIDLGADGIDKYIEKVKELGVAMTDKQTDAIEEANDAILIMKTSFQGLGNQLAARLAPALNTGATAIANMTARVTASIPEWTAWAASILGVKRNLDSLTIADLNAELAQLLQDTGDMVGFRDALQNIADQTGDLVDPGTLSQLEFWNESIAELAERYNAATAALKKLTEAGEVSNAFGLQGGGEGADVAPSTSKRGEFGFDRTFEELKRFKAIRDEFDKNIAQFGMWESEAKSAFDSTREPIEALLIRLAEIRANPFIDTDLQDRTILEAVENYKAALEQMKNDTAEATMEMSEFQRRMFGNMQDILAETLFNPWDEGLDGMLKSFVDMLRKMVAQILATKILEFLFGLLGNSGTSATGITASGASSGGRAIGGSATRGVPLTVGEGGPELFTPGASGSIRPLGAVSISQENNFGGGGIDVATLIPILEENNKKVKAEILDAFDRGAFA